MAKQATPLETDSYTNMITAEKELFKPGSFYEWSLFSVILTMSFVAIDFACLYSVWNAVLTESFIMVILFALGCAICLDVPLVYAALAIRKCEQRLMSRKSAILITTLAVLAFLIIFSLSTWLRIEMRDFIFSLSTGGGITNTVAGSEAVETVESNGPMVAAIVNSILPMCTSFASFLATYYAYNPAKDLYKKLRLQNISYFSRSTMTKQAVAEGEKVPQYREFLLRRNKDLFDQRNDFVTAMGEEKKQAARIAVMEKANTPNAITEITQSAIVLNERSSLNSDPYTSAADIMSGSAESEVIK